MTQYLDMGTRTMVASGKYVRAVGWLGSNPSLFGQGVVPKTVLDRIAAFVHLWRTSTKELWWGTFRGLYECELCRQPRWYDRFSSYGNFGVPSGNLLFVAPEMILHCIKSHKYCPPDEFCRAVLKSPLPGTAAYRAEVKGFRDLRIRTRFRGYYRWKKAHPQFPGVRECLRIDALAKTHRAFDADLQKGMEWELYENAAGNVDELIAVFREETRKFGHVVLSVLADAALVEALPVFIECLWSADEDLQYCAKRGLRAIGNRKALAALRDFERDTTTKKGKRKALEK
jgi:hypothetical protein